MKPRRSPRLDYRDGEQRERSENREHREHREHRERSEHREQHSEQQDDYLTAEMLRTNYDRRDIIRGIVENQIKSIDQRITRAYQAGNCKLEVDIPLVYNLNNMSLSDAQTLIFTELLAHYMTAFPGTKIEITPSYTKLHVIWDNGLSEDDRNKRLIFLKKNQIGQ